MFEHFERLVGALVVVMAFLTFWSPYLVTFISLCLIICLAIKYHFGGKSGVDPSPQTTRQQMSQQMSSDVRFGLNPNVRQIKSGRRQVHFQTRSVDNYANNYSTNQLNSNYFLQSDGLLSSMTGHSLSLRPQSANDLSYSSAMYRPIRESPNSQLGNIPFVKLSSSGSESTTHELKLKTQTVKPVTVRIAPMPQNLSKLMSNRMSSINTSNVSTLGTIDSVLKGPNASTQTKTIVEALKRKRNQKNELEMEDNSKLSTNKKAKRDSIKAQKIPNGLITSPNKQSAKRQSVEGTALLHKRFKNNEILSSYSSLKTTPQLSQSFKTKRKLSPDSSESNEMMNKKSLLPEMESTFDSTSNDYRIGSEENSLSLSLNEGVREEPEGMGPKKAYGLPLHLHSMADHERDRNKARHRLNRYLNAVKEASTPPKGQTNEVQTTTTPAIDQSSSSAQIGLPSVPAAAIFTTSRVETIVTTTLLNTPISSVLTTTRESMSPQKQSADHSDNCSMSSAPNSPEVSTIVAPFTSSTPLSTPISVSKTTSNEITFKFEAKPIESTASSGRTAPVSTQAFIGSNNIFNGPNITSSGLGLQSNSIDSSSSLTIPQFSTISPSVPQSIPNFGQMPANTGIPSFTSSSVPTFGSNPQQNTMFAAEAPALSFFSVGAGSTSRRIAQNSRLRSRQKR